MVDLGIIRKKKARKMVAIGGSICAGCVAVFCAIALLGQRAAPLTVILNNSGASLTLAESVKEGSETSSFLLAKNAPSYTEYDGRSFDYYAGELDSELSETVLTSDLESTLFFKYTFYVENTGSKASDYSLSLNISYPNRTVSSFDLAEILRVRFYENEDLSQHNFKTYAKAHSYYDASAGEYVEGPEHVTNSSSDFAEMFESNKTILTSNISNFQPSSKMRYTFVLWLEGNDPDSEGKDAPVGCSIALGVNISAHESTTATTSGEGTSEGA